MDNPHVIAGGIFSDSRGGINHVNSFDFRDVKRFYVIHHVDTTVVRAWQGHKVEKKYFYVTQGSFFVAWVKIDDWENPSPDLKAESIVLSTTESRILAIPAGYANGLKALEPNSSITVFSDLSLEQSLQEKIRFDQHLWVSWENISKNSY